MNLSMKFLYLQLKKHYKEVQLWLPSEKNPFCSGIQLFPASAWIPVHDMLYITNATTQVLNNSILPRSTRLVILDDSPPRHLPYPCLIFPAFYSRSLIINDILAIFYRYNHWSQQVTEAILKNQSLQELLEITCTVEENPMYFADPSFKMLAHTGKDMEEFSIIWRYQVHHRYLPFHVMMNLTKTGELELLNNTQHAFYADTKSFTSKFISKAIHYNGKLQGHFFIIESYRKLNQCDIEIAEYMGNLLASSNHQTHNYLTTSSLYHEHFMIDVLEGTLREKSSIRDQLKPFGWSLSGNYRLLEVPMPNDNDTLKRNAIALLCNGFQSQAFLYQKSILVLYNEPISKNLVLQKNIKHFLQILNRYGALSETFTDFCKMPAYYQQTSFILQNNSQTPSCRLLLYEDYYFSHLLSLADGKLPLYQPAELLHQYDLRNGSEYCHTLYTYLLNEQNAVHTAQQLFLHRNTLKYRLTKIREIIQVPLEHPMVRQRLLLSLHALENVKKE